MGPSAVGEGHVLKVHAALQVVRGQVPIVHHGRLPVDELEHLLGGPHSLHQATVDGAHGLRGEGTQAVVLPTPRLCRQRARAQRQFWGRGCRALLGPPWLGQQFMTIRRKRSWGQGAWASGSSRLNLSTTQRREPERREGKGSSQNMPEHARTGVGPSPSATKISILKAGLNLYISVGKKARDVNTDSNDGSFH